MFSTLIELFLLNNIWKRCVRYSFLTVTETLLFSLYQSEESLSYVPHHYFILVLSELSFKKKIY